MSHILNLATEHRHEHIAHEATSWEHANLVGAVRERKKYRIPTGDEVRQS